MLLNDPFLNAQSKKPFPYVLNEKREILIMSAGVVTLGVALILQTNKPNLSREYIERLNSNSINSFDISATRQWSKGAHTASDILRTTMVLTPAFLIIPELINKEYKNAFALFSMYSEALLINGGISLLAKNIANRGRPYLYNSSLTVDEKLQQKEPFYSFFSGHTSVTFCTAVFISKVFSDLYPDSKWKFARSIHNSISPI
jgi:hypothetical protein